MCEITADYTDLIYAATPEEIETRRKCSHRNAHRRARAALECPLGVAGRPRPA